MARSRRIRKTRSLGKFFYLIKVFPNIIKYNPPYEYIYEFKGERFGTAVCPSCLRPCFQSNELTVGSKLQQLRPDIRVYKKYCPVHGEKDFRKSPCQVCSNPQNAANFGVCVPCVNKLCREKNILLHDYVTIADEKFIEECNTK